MCLCPQITDKEERGEAPEAGIEVVGQRGVGQCPSGESPLEFIRDSEGQCIAHWLAQSLGT